MPEETRYLVVPRLQNRFWVQRLFHEMSAPESVVRRQIGDERFESLVKKGGLVAEGQPSPVVFEPEPEPEQESAPKGRGRKRDE